MLVHHLHHVNAEVFVSRARTSPQRLRWIDRGDRFGMGRLAVYMGRTPPHPPPVQALDALNSFNTSPICMPTHDQSPRSPFKR